MLHCAAGQRGCQLPSFLVRMGAGWGDPLGSVSLPSDGMNPRPCLTACNSSLLITGHLPLPNPSPYQGRTLPCSLPARVREPQAATAVQPQLVLCVRPSQEQPFSARVGMPILEPCSVVLGCFLFFFPAIASGEVLQYFMISQTHFHCSQLI